MGKPARTLQKILGGLADANIRFSDLIGLLKNLGFAEPTIRQILNGTYSPARRLGIGRWQPKSSRGNG